MNSVNFENQFFFWPNLEKQDRFAKAIPLEKRVGVALWRLAAGNSFCSFDKTFAIGNSTAVKITYDFYDKIVWISSNFTNFPQSQIEAPTAIKLFKSDCNFKFLKTVGAIDGTHIFIQTPENERKFDCCCRKQR